MDEHELQLERETDDARFGAASKARLEELVAFAQAYRGWSHRELAAFLGRDVHNVIPKSGIPKADLIVRLARALDWTPGAVFEQVCGERDAGSSASPRQRAGRPGLDAGYAEINRLAYAAFTEGRFEEMISSALRMQRVARTPAELAEACLRECGGWEGLGRYEQASEALARALREPDVPRDLMLRLRGNFAQVSFLLGRHLEAEGAASAVLEALGSGASGDQALDGSRAMALYSRGQALRCRSMIERHDRPALAVRACEDLAAGERAWEAHSKRVGVETYAAFAEMCRAARGCAEVLAGLADADSAIDRCIDRLGELEGRLNATGGLWAEAAGWWCVCGAEVVHFESAPAHDVQQVLAVLTNKGHEIATLTGNWALRERVLTIEYLRSTNGVAAISAANEIVLDREDVQVLAGAMARFPAFRPYGWHLWRAARRVNE